MAKGIKTGGRKKGSRNKATIARENEINGRRMSPLAYMLKVMRNSKADKDRRDRMGVAAAPYVHPRLNSIQGVPDLPVEVRETLELTDAARRIAFVLAAGVASIPAQPQPKAKKREPA